MEFKAMFDMIISEMRKSNSEDYDFKIFSMATPLCLARYLHFRFYIFFTAGSLLRNGKNLLQLYYLEKCIKIFMNSFDFKY